jgi:hypothetical protein
MDARAVRTDDGVTLTWRAPDDRRVAGYVVSRAATTRTWGIDWKQITPKPIAGTSFADRSHPERGEAYVYLIRSIDEKGAESFEPAIARTQPPVPLGLVATHNAAGRIEVAWNRSPAADVVGYNLYRAPVTGGGLYGFRPIKGVGEFTKINDAPVRDTRFIDPEKPAKGEMGWAFEPRAYRVRAVNWLGVESGPSPWVVTVPAAVTGIRARRRDDGAVVVSWKKDPNPNVVGYVVYRMDNWRNDLVTRVNAVPTTATVLVDRAGRPTGERQRYWVVAVDRFGQEGPSGTGPWSFNRP